MALAKTCRSALTIQGGHPMLHRLVPLVLETIVLSGAVAVAAPPVRYALGGPDCDAVNFPIKAGQEVSQQFVTKAEVDVLRQSGKLVPNRPSGR
jgi:hypothetical protein